MTANYIPTVYDVDVRKPDILIRSCFIVKLLKQKPIAAYFKSYIV